MTARLGLGIRLPNSGPLSTDGDPDEAEERLEAYREAGARHVLKFICHDLDQLREMITRVAERSLRRAPVLAGAAR